LCLYGLVVISYSGLAAPLASEVVSIMLLVVCVAAYGNRALLIVRCRPHYDIVEAKPDLTAAGGAI
jgi:hypothetical protein